MKKIIVKQAYLTIRKFENTNDDKKYNFLTPNKKGEGISEYCKALKIALEKEEVNNIAVTGPYGSGKSSFINTFFDTHPEYEPVFLSLATFKKLDEEIESKSAELKKPSIEKRLIKQLFYQTTPSNIPLSKFKRINESGFWRKTFLRVVVPLSLIYIAAYTTWIFNSDIIDNFLLPGLVNYKTYIIYSGLAIYIFFLILNFYRFSIYLKGRSLRLIKLNAIEFEKEPDNEFSVFDRNLDEILYFFDSHKYDVVVIEDLDRNKDLEIFTKFRELNSLINSYRKNKEDIKFIYAIGDDLFDKKSRVKFFDFIIPVIPYVNPGNSYAKFLNLLGNYIESDKLSKSLIRNISFIIDDYRLLTNIVNEYLMYRENVINDLNKNKLLSIIVYKNIYPKDFALIHTSGDEEVKLKKLFENKNQFIEIIKNNITNKKRELEIKLNDLSKQIDSEIVQKITHLKIIYLYELKSFINNQDIIQIRVGGGTYQKGNFHAILNDVDTAFESLENNGFEGLNVHGGAIKKYSFTDLQEMVNPKIQFSQRKQLIESNSIEVLKSIKQKISDYEDDLSRVKLSSTKELLKYEGSRSVVFNGIECEITKYLVSSGFIDEDYLRYISYFFEGGITIEDIQFSLSLESEEIIPPDKNVPNSTELLYELDDRDFKIPNILNYDIAISLIENKDRIELKDKYLVFLDLLCDNSKRSIDFAFSTPFFKYLLQILPDLTNRWKNIWECFLESNPDDYKINSFLYEIINNLQISEVLLINIDGSISKKIESLNSLNLFKTSELVKHKKLIKKLSLYFYKLNDISSNLELFKYIYENENFKCYPNILRLIAKNILNYEYSTYLSSIYDSGSESLIYLFEKKLNHYIGLVALNDDDYKVENPKILLYLLNHTDLELEHKSEIISKFNFQIDSVTDLNNMELLVPAIKRNLIAVSWENVFNIYVENNDAIIELIKSFSIHKAYSELSNKLNENTFDDIEDEEIYSFGKFIIENDNFDIDAYIHFINLINIQYDDIELSNLSSKKLKVLETAYCIDYSKNHVLKLPSEIKVRYILRYLEQFSEELVEEGSFESYALQDQDYINLLGNVEIDNEYFIFFINYINFNELSVDVVNELIKLILLRINAENANKKPDKIWLDESSVQALITNSNNTSIIVQLLTLIVNQYSVDEIRSMLVLMKDPFKNLGLKRGVGIKNPILEKNTLNENLLTELVSANVISSYKTRKAIFNKVFRNEEFTINLKAS